MIQPSSSVLTAAAGAGGGQLGGSGGHRVSGNHAADGGGGIKRGFDEIGEGEGGGDGGGDDGAERGKVFMGLPGWVEVGPGRNCSKRPSTHLPTLVS